MADHVVLALPRDIAQRDGLQPHEHVRGPVGDLQPCGQLVNRNQWSEKATGAEDAKPGPWLVIVERRRVMQVTVHCNECEGSI